MFGRISNFVFFRERKSSDVLSFYSEKQIELLEDYLKTAFKTGYIYNQDNSLDKKIIIGLKQNLLIKKDKDDENYYTITERGVDVFQTGGIRLHYERLKNQDRLMKTQIHTSWLALIVSVLALLVSGISLFLVC